MYFIKIEAGLPVGYLLIEGNIRDIFPDLPSGYIQNESIPNYAHYLKTDKPVSADLTIESVEVDAIKNGDGAFVQTWEERAKVFATDEDRQAAIAATNAAKLSNLRTRRNELIKATDAYALQDVMLTNDMKTYRQALRDLPANTSDLDDITWPVSPEASTAPTAI